MWDVIFERLAGWWFRLPVEKRTQRLACGSALVLIIWVSWCLGAIPIAGDGFAKAIDVADVKISMTESSIEQSRKEECHLPAGNTRVFFNRLVNQRMRVYRQLTGTDFLLPDCKDE